jgi:hypothetical protein
MQQRNELEYVLSKVLSIGDKQRYLERFDKLADIYENAMSICHNVIEFYKILIRDLYLLLNMEDLGEFFYKNSISLYYSGLIDNYLPQIISSTSNQEFSLINLLEKLSIFKPPYFRSLETDIEINFENKNQIINNLDTIINLLRHKKIIPSNQIILWSLQLAGIRHFGNDFNFHDSMHSVLNSLAITNNVNSLQVTLPKQDGSNFVEFDNVKSYHIQNSGNKKRIVKTLTKKSRVNDIPNLYLHAGALVGDLWEEFNKSKITRKLNMGKLL